MVKLHQIDWEKTGELVDKKMWEKNMSSDFVAHKACLNVKTVNSLRKGNNVNANSLHLIQQVLGFEAITITQVEAGDSMAPAHLGKYSRAGYESYAGTYHMFRQSYDSASRVICSRFGIWWDSDACCLAWRETQDNRGANGKRFQYDFKGKVAIPPGLPITQFIRTTEKGFSRVITATNLRGGQPEYFRGVLLGISENADLGHLPAASAVYIERVTETVPETIGSFDINEIWHRTVQTELAAARKHYMA